MLIPSELDKLLALYQSIQTIVVFIAGFVFVTIPIVIFSIDISSLYGRLVLYWLLASLLIFTTVIDVYHSGILRMWSNTLPDAFRIFTSRMPGGGLADQMIGVAMFFALSSISFMLLLRAEEMIIEATIWFLLSVTRSVSGHFMVHHYLKRPNKTSVP